MAEKGAQTPPNGSQGGIFLEGRRYRLQRVSDAARLLPVVFVVLIFLPLLWPVDGGRESITTVRAGGYLFGVWLLVIIAALLLARPLGRLQDERNRTDRGDADL